jgi:ribulose-5-phosphate 4-epimerase/fuculose-1-phosphate aldolase
MAQSIAHAEFETPRVDRNTPECVALKCNLAAAFRIIARRKMDDGIAGHISCRVPGTDDQFWVNPLGLLFEEVTADDLLVVDRAGRVLEGQRPYNQAAFAIHSTLHEERPDVVSICHTHPPRGTAFSALGIPIKMVDQTACSFYDHHALVSEYDGVVNTKDQARGLARGIAGKRVAVLQNHGLITLGQSVEQAVVDMLDLERTCELALALLPKWDDVVPVPDEAAAQARATFTHPVRIALQWRALVRQVAKQEPHFAGSLRTRLQVLP